MPHPLSEEEIEIIRRLLARFYFASELTLDDPEPWKTPVPLNPEWPRSNKIGQVLDPFRLAKAGAHHQAIQQYSNSILPKDGPLTDLHIAISALVWGELEVAEEWARRVLEMLEAEFESGEELPDWRSRELEILKLAKVFRRLGKTEEEGLLKKRFQEILPAFWAERDAAMDALRLTVELGYDQEAEALVLKMAPLTVGHSRGNLLRRLFQIMFSQRKEMLALALFAVTPDSHDEGGIRYVAMEVACDRGDFNLALRIAAHPGNSGIEDRPHLVTMADWLIKHGRVHEWKGIWAMVKDQKSNLQYAFPDETKLKFLATLVEHVTPAERGEIFKISKQIAQPYTRSHDRQFAQEIANYHFVIAAWGASKSVVRQMIKVSKIPKHRIGSMIRAAAERGLPSILDLVPEAQSTFLWRDPITALRYEFELYQRGKRNRLETVYAQSLQNALATHDEGTVQTIVRFVGTTWKDLDRYRDLLVQYPSQIGLSRVSLWPFTKPLIKSGDLRGFAAELDKVDEAFCLAEMNDDLFDCIANRIGLKRELEGF